MKILPMKLRWAPQVASLIAAIIGDLHYYNQRARTGEVAKYTSAYLRQLVRRDKDSVLVATVGVDPVAFCISTYDDGLISLVWYGVQREFRRHGLGEQLLTALEQTVHQRNAHKIWCDTRTSNLPSQRLLVRMGYRKIATLTRHWYEQDFFLWEKYPERKRTKAPRSCPNCRN